MPSGDAHALPSSPPEYSPLAAGARPPRRWVTVVAIVVALLLGAGVALLVQRSSVPSHEVPGGLVGRQYSEINDYVGEFGWRIVPRDTRRDDTAAGEILATDPAAGESLREGDELVVTRSLGPTLVDVPTDLEGLERGEAEQALIDAQLVAEVQEQYSEEVDEGLVISVGDVGEQAPKGSAVPLVVSLGPEPLVVPEGIVGQNFDDARATLEGLGLEVDREVDDDAEGGENEVVDVDPGEGQEVDEEDTVTLVVTSGTTEVPDVGGMLLSEARDELEGAGLEPGAVIGRGDGTVIGTFPSAGSQVQSDSQVQIFMR
jgi:serine/threonine-protein kinase